LQRQQCSSAAPSAPFSWNIVRVASAPHVPLCGFRVPAICD
jgi:hypothetical protein